MTHVTDYKRDSMQTVLGSSVTNIDDLEKLYLAAAGATADDVNRAWHQVFLLNGATSANWNTAAQEFLLSLGAPSNNVSDNWDWFWVTNGGVIGPSVAYDPGMMTLSSGGYYSITQTTSGNKFTMVLRVNRASFTGDTVEYIKQMLIGGGSRIRMYVGSSDYTGDTTLRNKMYISTENAAGTVNLFRGKTIVDICDSVDHLIFYSVDTDTGQATIYVDGVDSDDTGWGSRVSPTVGSTAVGSTAFGLGAGSGGGLPFNGDIGYYGYRDAYLTNPTDFYHPTNGLQELDEATWTEWGAQPLFWNDEGTMTATGFSG